MTETVGGVISRTKRQSCWQISMWGLTLAESIKHRSARSWYVDWGRMLASGCSPCCSYSQETTTRFLALFGADGVTGGCHAF